MTPKRKIEIRIETNEECLDNFGLNSVERELIERENYFLKELLKDLTLTNL